MKKVLLPACMFLLSLLCSCESMLNSMAFFPDTDYSVRKEKLPSYVDPINLTTNDGIMLEALYFRHSEKTGRIVIYFHGNAGNLYHRIHEGKIIFNMGYDLIISGYRGYGGSSGTPTEDGIYEDGKCILTYVTGTLNYSPDKVYLYGRSLGTTVAVHIAQNKDLGGVILITPLTSAAEFISEKFPGMLRSLGRKRFQSIEKINSLRSPLLVIHGTHDEVIPYNLGVKLYNAFSGRKEFVTIKGGGHNNLEFVDPGLYWSSVRNFLAR